MQEYVLFSQVAGERHTQVLQQCAGVSRMQPQAVEELHLIFRAKLPSGLLEILKTSGGGSQGVVPPEVQKTRTMLSTSLYHIQLVGTVQADAQYSEKHITNGQIDESNGVVISNGAVQKDSSTKLLKWAIDFRDTPEAGKQPVASRLLYRIPVLEGDIVKFIEDFGFQYISRYVVNGHKFYDQDTTLFLHKISAVSEPEVKTTGSNVTVMPKTVDLVPLGNSDEYILSASIESSDGSNSELRERAVRQLLVMKETLKGAVSLTPGDRLALDTKVSIPAGQRR